MSEFEYQGSLDHKRQNIDEMSVFGLSPNRIVQISPDAKFSGESISGVRI
jgi:hypothetical protein